VDIGSAPAFYEEYFECFLHRSKIGTTQEFEDIFILTKKLRERNELFVVVQETPLLCYRFLIKELLIVQ